MVGFKEMVVDQVTYSGDLVVTLSAEVYVAGRTTRLGTKWIMHNLSTNSFTIDREQRENYGNVEGRRHHCYARSD